MKRISQQRIAQELGVSQSLVSIVLNGRREGISEQTFNRIWKFARDHGYSPRGMRVDLYPEEKQGVKNIGYFLRSPFRLANKSNFFSHIHQGVHDYLKEHQVNTVFLGSEDDFSPHGLIKLPWQENSLDGIIIMGQVAPKFLLSVRKLGKPIVYVSARYPGMCHSVNSNEAQAGDLLVEHLYNLGHREFAYIGGTCAPLRHAERLQALEDALLIRKTGFRKKSLVIFKDRESNERNEGFEAAEILIDRFRGKTIPTAWICVNGLMARGVINCLRQNGLFVGRDISVAAFDMTRVCTEEKPGITGAGAIPEDIGREAARIIIEESKSGERGIFSDVVLPSAIQLRESFGPPVKSQKIHA